MSFFEVFGNDEPDEEDELEDEEEQEPPAWHGPPENELGAVVPQALVVARSEHGVVALTRVAAYSTGASLDFLAVLRDLPRRQLNRVFTDQHRYEAGDDEDELPDGFLRLGVELADGTKASNLGGRWFRRGRRDDEPQPPLFTQHGGSSGGGGPRRITMHSGYWLWPLPPPGPLRISCEWPVADIELTSAELDASAIVAAAERSTALWP